VPGNRIIATLKDAAIAAHQLIMIGSWKPFGGETLQMLEDRLKGAQTSPAQDWGFRLETPEEFKKAWLP
jgi:hypothetical protein